ncbi:hypothetical protein HBH50_208860 [Parastagonospora nodorum]|nr:hypothetical protein HBH50_208860 [Parastagonospora nodorum]KAH4080745.1 hypothetical protein HBH48_207450 [Parastagonospora nodorum]
MAPDTPAPALSLIVTLRYKPPCSKCSDMLARWCAPATSPDEPTGDAPIWTWDMSALRASAMGCRCCRFLVDTAHAIPGVQCSDGDQVRIEPELIGSKHSTPYERAYQEWSNSKYYYSKEEDMVSQYMRYYRPILSLYQPLDNTDQGVHVKEMSNAQAYGLRAFNFILPAARKGSRAIEVTQDTEAFVGRAVGGTVDFNLVREWLGACTSTHEKQPCGEASSYSSPQDDCTSNYLDKHEERVTDPDGCRPKMMCVLHNFRLVDVEKKCVVRIHQPTEYAALSYVWGSAKRLLLTDSNQERLSTPGALSVDNEDVPQTFQDAFVIAENLSIRYLWIDALCICQNDADELKTHMDAMETVYSSAKLTIVSDTDSADTGIFGVSLPRKHPQATFTWAGRTYISARQTFGEALKSSPWESRAWCLQEKVFSKRLLVFTRSQVFYHCAASTWFEDTVMEPKANISGSIHMRERRHPQKKGLNSAGVRLNYTAYESHREHFGRNFWSLVRAYSRRQLSFESDVIRAFTGILSSIEPDFGYSVWGIPSKEFVRGLTWEHSFHRMDLRRQGFPSWSWTGWRSNAGVELYFKNCKRTDADLRVSRGRYRVDLNTTALVGPSVWTLDWYHCPNDSTNLFRLIDEPVSEAVPVQEKPLPAKSETSHPESSDEQVVATVRPEYILDAHCWRLAGHPRAKDESDEFRAQALGTWPQHMPLSQLTPDDKFHSKSQKLELSPLNHKPGVMPPLSHIIRFYTSIATVFIPADPDPDLSRAWDNSSASFDETRPLHKVCIPDSDEHIAVIDLDPAWQGLGRSHTAVYISRWCKSYAGEESAPTTRYSNSNEKLHILLLEDMEGWGEVKRRVQMLDIVDLADWRKAKPRWELVSLA